MRCILKWQSKIGRWSRTSGEDDVEKGYIVNMWQVQWRRASPHAMLFRLDQHRQHQRNIWGKGKVNVKQNGFISASFYKWTTFHIQNAKNLFRQIELESDSVGLHLARSEYWASAPLIRWLGNPLRIASVRGES